MPSDLSPADRVALDYCAPKGIPLSIFLGRVQGFGEPLWLEDDTRKAVAWQAEQNARCSGCGQPRSECMSEDAPDYEAEMWRCFACEVRDAKMVEVQREAQQGKASNHGAYFVVVKTEEPADGDIAVSG